MEFKSYWYCDVCGEKIAKVEDGWVECLITLNPEITDELERFRQRRGTGLRLVHHRSTNPRCAYSVSAGLQDMPLNHFLGPDGLMALLSFLDEKILPQEEIMELIKRLHIPGYEQARCYFEEAISEGVFEPNTRAGFYWQTDIESVLRFVERRKE